MVVPVLSSLQLSLLRCASPAGTCFLPGIYPKMWARPQATGGLQRSFLAKTAAWEPKALGARRFALCPSSPAGKRRNPAEDRASWWPGSRGKAAGEEKAAGG